MCTKKTISDMSEDEYYDYLKTIPKHVSWRVRDAWLAVPPCSNNIPYCHADCPYSYECFPPEEPDSDDESWNEYYNNSI